MLTDTRRSPKAQVRYLPRGAVRWTKGFWAERTAVCARSMVPALERLFAAPEVSHVVENFRIAAGKAEGEHQGTPFGDGDFYKWIEAAAYALGAGADPGLDARLDEYIGLIGAAQRGDGYVFTKQIIAERASKGSLAPHADMNDFEVYNLGHLLTAACAHQRITGKDNLLGVAEKAAGYLGAFYEEAGRSGEVQTAVCPSHYMGLVELYRETGKRRYLETAELAIALRDRVRGGTDDNQDRIPLRQHRKIVGHAVRSNYLYAGVADVYAETGEAELKTVLDSVWADMVERKLYITGGCGALYDGVSPYGVLLESQKVHQAYGHDYQLPNITAYNETCAQIGSVLWSQRMFSVDPDAKYFDVIERTMHNAILSAVSLDGRRYFYQNALRRELELPYKLIWSPKREQYIWVFCCPPNLARTIMQSSEYAYAVSADAVWTGLYGASEARVALDCGADFRLAQETAYPWDGRIAIAACDFRSFAPFTLNVRVPAWVESGCVEGGSGPRRELTAADAGGYVPVRIDSPGSASVVARFDMPVRLSVGHPLIEETTGQVAVERGPLVYCAETADVEAGVGLDSVSLFLDGGFEEERLDLGAGEMVALRTQAAVLDPVAWGRSLYKNAAGRKYRRSSVRLVPYYAWDNRGFGEMRIWLPAIGRR